MWEGQRNTRIQGCLPKDALFPSILFFRERKLEYARASDRELRHYKRNQKKTKLGGWGGSAGKGACYQARLPEPYSQPTARKQELTLELVLCPLHVPHTYIHVLHTHRHVPHTYIHVPYRYITQTTWLLHLEHLRKYKIKSKDRVATFKQSISFKSLISLLNWKLWLKYKYPEMWPTAKLESFFLPESKT